MRRLTIALLVMCLVGALCAPAAAARSPSDDPVAPGPPYPDPIDGVRVYDYAEVLSDETIMAVEATIRAIEERSGAQIAVYTQVKPESDTPEEAERDAAALIDQWGLGRPGIDDGLAVLFDLEPSLCHGQVQLFAAPGYAAAYLTDQKRQVIFEEDMLPALRECDIDAALLLAMEAIDAATGENDLAPGPLPTPEELDVVASRIKACVEDLRGLEALADVPVRSVRSQEAIADLLGALQDEEVDRIRAEGILLKRIGLLPPEMDVLATMEDFIETAAGGYFRPETGDVAIVDDDDLLDSADEWLLAHEYLHALQEQHFGVDAVKDAAAPGDGQSAVVALAEGDAVLLTVAMARDGALPAAPSPTEPALLAADAELDALPLLVRRELIFPYLDGTDFVQHIWDRGGWPAVDEVWLDPPTSTEQIMHPVLYPDEEPIPVQLPDVAGLLGEGWIAGLETTMGELRVSVFVAADESFEIPLPVPARVTLPNTAAAAGWGGDRIVTVDGPADEWVVVWQTAWDTRADADEFEEAVVVAMHDLPGTHAVVSGIDIGGAAPDDRSVLLLVARGDASMSHLRESLEIN